MRPFRTLLVGLCCALGSLPVQAEPVRLIFDTDLGNDTDDALALAVIHALQSRGECRLLAVTISNDDEQAAPFVDALNTFYSRGEIPIGVVRNGVKEPPSRYLHVARQRDQDRERYPHDVRSGSECPEATGLLRSTLAAQPDGSVVVVQVGFSTNLARLLDSPADSVAPLTGQALVARKVQLLSLMAGSFDPQAPPEFTEYNVVKDVPAAQRVAHDWPTPLVWSGFEIGRAIPFPDASVEQDFGYVPHHPVAEAYWALQPKPINRPTWDLTSVLVALRPTRDYFTLSPPGRVTVDPRGRTKFVRDQAGRQRFLTVTPLQIEKTREALVQLVSQPPTATAPR